MTLRCAIYLDAAHRERLRVGRNRPLCTPRIERPGAVQRQAQRWRVGQIEQRCHQTVCGFGRRCRNVEMLRFGTIGQPRFEFATRFVQARHCELRRQARRNIQQIGAAGNLQPRRDAGCLAQHQIADLQPLRGQCDQRHVRRAGAFHWRLSRHGLPHHVDATDRQILNIEFSRQQPQRMPRETDVVDGEPGAVAVAEVDMLEAALRQQRPLEFAERHAALG